MVDLAKWGRGKRNLQRPNEEGRARRLKSLDRLIKLVKKLASVTSLSRRKGWGMN